MFIHCWLSPPKEYLSLDEDECLMCANRLNLHHFRQGDIQKYHQFCGFTESLISGEGVWDSWPIKSDVDNLK